MDYKNVIFEQNGQVAIVRLNRPERLNALDKDTFDSLERVMDYISSTKSIKAVIITGAGEKSFSTGADVKYISGISDPAGFVDMVHGVFDKIEEMDVPVIAAVNGYCLGGGCELAMACDIRIASSTAVFGQPEVKLGIIPGGGGTYRLPLLVGPAKAKELIFSGESITAQEALRIGLVNTVVSPDALIKEALAIAHKISKNSGNAIRSAKSAINANACKDGSEEKSAFVSSFNSDDRREGIGAFIEKREAKF